MASSGYDLCKRLLDLAGGVVGLAACSPIQAVVAVLVAVRLGRPVLFRQSRPGKDGRPFTLYKFRTMRPTDPARGWTTDESRLTNLGRLLRSTSLDELPSLWNVVRGDMSFVGPRPLLLHYLELYTPAQARRHEVRPGITGLAQVSGRNAASWVDRLRLDVVYVDHRSFALDLRILAATLGTVLRRDGISAPGSATMPEFRGEPAVRDAE